MGLRLPVEMIRVCHIDEGFGFRGRHSVESNDNSALKAGEPDARERARPVREASRSNGPS